MLCDDREGWDRLGVRGRFKRKGTYVYLRTTHVVVWQKPTQHYKAIVSNLKKKNFFFKGLYREVHRGGAWEGPKQKESTWALRSIIQKGPKAQGLQWGTDIPVTRIYFSTVGPGKNGNPLPLALVNESFELMMHP